MGGSAAPTLFIRLWGSFGATGLFPACATFAPCPAAPAPSFPPAPEGGPFGTQATRSSGSPAMTTRRMGRR